MTLTDNDKPRALGELTVIELADESAAFCGKLLAGLGAKVIKVEAPGGDPSRRLGPFYQNIPHPDRSLSFWYDNTNKRSVVLDLETSDGREAFLRLIGRADVLLETQPPGYLDRLGIGWPKLKAVNPRLVLTSVTPFGQEGPYSGYRSSDLISLAMGGMLSTTGDADRPPLRVFGSQSYHFASFFAAIGTLAALRQRAMSGRGLKVDVSIQASVTALLEYANLLYISRSKVRRRQGSLHPLCSPRFLFDASDGQVTFHPGPSWNNWVNWLVEEGHADDLADERYAEANFRRQHPEHVDSIMEAWARTHTQEELIRKGQELRLPFANVNTLKEVLAHPQLRARGFFVPVAHPELGKEFEYPGPPFLLGETPFRIDRTAPRVGEDTREILDGTLNGGESTVAPEPNPVDGRTGSGRPPVSVISPAKPDGEVTAWPLPLKGLRVVDFTRILAGPFAARLMADLGAEVIKVEMRATGDTGRGVFLFPDEPIEVNGSGHFNNLNRHKLSITLDPNQPKGLALTKRLIAASDVVIENFSVRAMPKWGLTYEQVRKIRPDIIMISMPGLGGTGPQREFVSLAPTLHAFSGLAHLTGWPDRSPVGPGTSIADHAGGLSATVAILAALEHRQISGKGQYIDLSQFEALCSLLGPALLDLAINGNEAERQGNRLEYSAAAPHGVYPCLGDDRWCAIAVFSDDDWRRLGEALGNPPRVGSPRFATSEGRLAHAAEIDELLSAWTRERRAEAVMELLQRHGIAAGVVQDGEDLVERDPQLRARAFWSEAEHPELGRTKYEGLPFQMDGTAFHVRRSAPLLGEHNHYVLAEILGLTEEEIDALYLDQVI